MPRTFILSGDPDIVIWEQDASRLMQQFINRDDPHRSSVEHVFVEQFAIKRARANRPTKSSSWGIAHGDTIVIADDVTRGIAAWHAKKGV